MAMLLRRGDRGKSVREVQGLINSKAGKIIVNADGAFGPKTEEAVKTFQASVKLKNDGIVGAKTWDALHSNSLAANFNNCVPAHDWFCILKLQQFFANVAKQTAEGAVAATHVSQKSSPAVPSRPAVAARPAVVANTAKVPSASQSHSAVSVPSIVKATDFKNFQRASFAGYEGQSYIIKDFLKFKGYAIKLLGGEEIIRPHPQEALPDGFRNECAQFVQYFAVPRTSHWRQGPRVCDFKPGELPVGTVVATLREKKYYSDHSGRSHVGIYLGHDDYSSYLTSHSQAAGVTLFDQWNGVRIASRKKTYAADANQDGKPLKNNKTWIDSLGAVHNRRVRWGDDGEEYYVVLTKL